MLRVGVIAWSRENPADPGNYIGAVHSHVQPGAIRKVPKDTPQVNPQDDFIYSKKDTPQQYFDKLNAWKDRMIALFEDAVKNNKPYTTENPVFNTPLDYFRATPHGQLIAYGAPPASHYTVMYVDR